MNKKIVWSKKIAILELIRIASFLDYIGFPVYVDDILNFRSCKFVIKRITTYVTQRRASFSDAL